jgi:putative component of toxin-antitoxin plasmid stabilization module
VSARVCSSAQSTGARVIGSIFGRDGKALVILLGGGTKKGQEDDIKRAKECWSDYRDRKAKE